MVRACGSPLSIQFRFWRRLWQTTILVRPGFIARDKRHWFSPAFRSPPRALLCARLSPLHPPSPPHIQPVKPPRPLRLHPLHPPEPPHARRSSPICARISITSLSSTRRTVPSTPTSDRFQAWIIWPRPRLARTVFASTTASARPGSFPFCSRPPTRRTRTTPGRRSLPSPTADAWTSSSSTRRKISC